MMSTYILYVADRLLVSRKEVGREGGRAGGRYTGFHLKPYSVFICVCLSLLPFFHSFLPPSLQVSLGYEKHYNVQNPFEWMELISLQGKTNFFEKRVGEYQKAGVMANHNKSGGPGGAAPRTFSTDADF